ncbi:thiamine ABC transporter ATP-binding protein [Pseudaestuariivita sp.]|uniref:thiamine ABC transporter ATP-binding protein n=1 Tax=Pseudaestuariivita sp. TaxID=2211669 RepID=UPI0040581F97
MLEFRDVTIRAGDFALRADWRLEAGQVCAVIGPSGAGKSTLLGALAGFADVTEGDIRWEGARVDQAEPAARPVAMLFQDNNLFPHLTAFQNLALAATGSGRVPRSLQGRLEAALADVGLPGLGDRKPAALSGGQQARVALARVLLQDKPVLLLDEPFAGLGPALKDEMLDMVAQVARTHGKTVLMVTHDPADARRIAPVTSVVVEGVAEAPAPTDTVLDAPPEALARYLGTARR